MNYKKMFNEWLVENSDRLGNFEFNKIKDDYDNLTNDYDYKHLINKIEHYIKYGVWTKIKKPLTIEQLLIIVLKKLDKLEKLIDYIYNQDKE